MGLFRKKEIDTTENFAADDMKTAEEYRRLAENHRAAAKNMRTTFFRTGFFMTAAVVVVIVMTIAWFVSNNRVGASGAKIGAESTERYVIASAGTRQKVEEDKYKENGENILSGAVGSVYDEYYDTLTGKKITLQGDNKLTLYNCSAWHLQDEGVMRPGAKGVLEFYVIPQVDSLTEITFSLQIAAYKAVADANNPVQSIDNETVNKLLEGHILFFENVNDVNGYSGWLGTNGNRITVKDKNGTLEKGVPYKVSIYWTWPRRYRNFIYHQKSTHGDLFATDSNDYNYLIKFINDYPEKIFYGNDIPKFRTVDFSTDINMSDEIYRRSSSYYNQADEYIGNNVDYIYLEILESLKTKTE